MPVVDAIKLSGRRFPRISRFSVAVALSNGHQRIAIQRPSSSRTNKMLDSFEIVTTSGVVLWSRSYANVGANLINSLIKEVFIEGQATWTVEDEQASTKPSYKKDQYTLKWTTFKELGLIFVVRALFIHISNYY